MTVCTDNLLKDSSKGAKPRAESDCKHRLLKDTANEAVMETVSCARAKSDREACEQRVRDAAAQMSAMCG